MRKIIYIAAFGILCAVLTSCAGKPGDESGVKGSKNAGGAGKAGAAANDRSGPPKGVIDAIDGDPVIGARLSLRGWAAAPYDGAPLKKVEVLLDGRVVAQASTGLPRQDVVDVYHRPDWLKSGWSAEFYLNNIKPGQHKVDVVGYDSRNLNGILQGSKMLTVKGADQKSAT